MSAAAPTSDSRKRRRHPFFLPSCFSPSSSIYHDDDAPPQPSLCIRLRRQSRTVPCHEITAVHGGDVNEAALNATRKPSYRRKRLPGNPRKAEVQKFSKPLTHKSLSTLGLLNRSDEQQSSINHHTCKHMSCHQPASAVHHHVHDQVQRGGWTSHFGLPDPTRPVPSARSGIKASQVLGTLTGLIMVGTMMAVTLLYGRIFAIFGTCLCFYVLPFLRSMQPLPTQEMESKEELDVGWEEHKKKVVLMGLLERNNQRQ